MPTLAEVQRCFRTALHDEQPDALVPLVSSHGRAAAARIETYRSMYWARQVDALKADFPSVKRLVGESLFERIAVTHLKRSPSTSPSLAWLGRGLEATLESLGLLDEAEVARLEWARNESFWSPAAAALSLESLSALGDSLALTSFRFHPSFRLVDLAAGVCAEVDGTPCGIDRSLRRKVAVWRLTSGAVFHLEVDSLEGLALARASAGAPFGVACEAFEASEDAGGAATAALLRWVAEGWLMGVV